MGVKFLGPGYYYPSTEKNRFTQFGAVGYIITLYSSKSYAKSLGVRAIFLKVRTPTPSGCAMVMDGVLVFTDYDVSIAGARCFIFY